MILMGGRGSACTRSLALALAIAGCGGGGSASPSDDAKDGAIQDASSVDAATQNEAGASDTIGDARATVDAESIDSSRVDASCVRTGCTLDAGGDASTSHGLRCEDVASCAACTDVVDDEGCGLAYGPGNICVSGECVAGCRRDAECARGELCTAATCVACASTSSCNESTLYAGNICAQGGCVPCLSDGDCASDPFYATANQRICIGGSCQVGTCTSSPNASCSPAVAGATGDACCAGQCVASSAGQPGSTSCCATSDCASLHGSLVCVANVCACPAPVVSQGTTPTVILWVNPQVAATTNGTGSDPVTCAFRSVADAIQYASTLAGTTAIINLTGATSTANGELFPLSPAANTTIQGTDAQGTLTTQTVTVGAGRNGVVLAQLGAVLRYLDIEPADDAGPTGIEATSRSGTDYAMTLDHLTIRNFTTESIEATGGNLLITNSILEGSDYGIEVNGGVVTVGGGTTIQNNASTGIYVGGRGSLTLDGTSGSVLLTGNRIAIELYNGYDIAVTGTLAGDVSHGLTSSVTLEGGDCLQQDRGDFSTLDLDGLLASNCSVELNVPVGLEYYEGVEVPFDGTLKVRRSAFIGGTGIVLTADQGIRGFSPSLFLSDFGTASDPGGNYFDATKSAALCLEAYGVTDVMPAEGNTWIGDSAYSHAITCTASGGVLTYGERCTAGISVSDDYYYYGTANGYSGTDPPIDVTSCTLVP